jgi:predicted dehydrogenase
MTAKLRIGVVGGNRGLGMAESFVAMEGRMEIVAVCDVDRQLLERNEKGLPGVGLYTDYDKMLAESDCDAVLIASPYTLHAEQALKAMESGRHVLSEVVAADTIEDCWRLVESVERTGVTYMLAENCCYGRHSTMVLNMVERGLFGELTYAEGAYIHDCRELLFSKDGTPTWRGLIRHRTDGNTYPTHSIGPVAQWFGINKKDRLVSAACFSTQQTSAMRYVERKFGPDNPASKPDWYKHGDSATTVLQTERGAVIVLRIDWVSVRPENTGHFVLQGSKGAYLSPRRKDEDHLVWIEGRGKATGDGIATDWENLERYSKEFEHALWRKFGPQTEKAGHGGIDFLVMHEFVEAVLEKRPSPIDVYDAVTWSAIVPLSLESIRRGGVPVEVPDFRSGRG